MSFERTPSRRLNRNGAARIWTVSYTLDLGKQPSERITVTVFWRASRVWKQGPLRTGVDDIGCAQSILGYRAVGVSAGRQKPTLSRRCTTPKVETDGWTRPVRRRRSGGSTRIRAPSEPRA